MRKWKVINLGDAASFFNGYPFKPTDWSSEGKEIIRIQNLTKSSSKPNFYSGNLPNKYLVKKGDLLISWSATLGIYEWHGKDAWLNQHIFKVVFDKASIDKNFFKYLISSSLTKMEEAVHGATMKHITKKKFDLLQIPLPPLEEQKKIATILDAADAVRRKDKDLINKYEELTEALFIDMFGDPVSNPKNWEMGVIRDLVIEAKYGTSSKASDVGAYPYLRMNNITYKGYMDYTSLKYIDVPEADKAKYLVRYGDLVFNRTNSKELVGKTGLITIDREMIIAGYLIRLRTNEHANPYFLWRYLNSAWAKATLQTMCKNIVGMANINAQELQNIPIFKPHIDLQNMFAERLTVIEQQKTIAQKSLEKSEQLFQSLLQKAFKGELTLKNTEELVPD